uniref:Polycystic kidney disease 2-like 2 protein n=1 Tax=Leptobrachium leishanense TaxID=445787 RepID=A0A8C5PTC4_9ANUR
MVSQDMYYLNNAMAKLFLETTVSETENTNFKSISTISDFWKFAEGPLVDGLYWNSWNNISSGGKSFVYHENLLLGVPQIRQIKVLPNKCNIHSYFINTIKECFTPYHFKYEDTAEFGFKNSSEWRYYLPQYLEWHWGQMGTYSSGGYISTLAQTKDKSKLKIQYLKRNNWLTRGTRVVFIDFSFYNANVNLFCVARLIVEFPATGGAIPSSKFYAVKLLRYVSDTDYFLAFCEILFLLVVSVLIFQDVMRFKEQKLQYFKYVWNWINLLIIASLLTVGFNVYRTVQVSLSLKNLLEDPNTYPNLHFLAYWQIQYNNVIALNVFFSWIKIFKYISFTTTMGLLSSALFRCAKDIMGFAVMFFIIFFSYAQLSFLIFGDEVTDFSTFANCIFTQFRIILGDFNFADIEKADKILGALYYVTFVFLAFFILMVSISIPQNLMYIIMSFSQYLTVILKKDLAFLLLFYLLSAKRFQDTVQEVQWVKTIQFYNTPKMQVNIATDRYSICCNIEELRVSIPVRTYNLDEDSY